MQQQSQLHQQQQSQGTAQVYRTPDKAVPNPDHGSNSSQVKSASNVKLQQPNNNEGNNNNQIVPSQQHQSGIKCTPTNVYSINSGSNNKQQPIIQQQQQQQQQALHQKKNSLDTNCKSPNNSSNINNNNHPSKSLQVKIFNLTIDQQRVIQARLPRNYRLVPLSQPQNSSLPGHNPTKKLLTNVNSKRNQSPQKLLPQSIFVSGADKTPKSPNSFLIQQQQYQESKREGIKHQGQPVFNLQQGQGSGIQNQGQNQRLMPNSKAHLHQTHHHGQYMYHGGQEQQIDQGQQVKISKNLEHHHSALQEQSQPVNLERNSNQNFMADNKFVSQQQQSSLTIQREDSNRLLRTNKQSVSLQRKFCEIGGDITNSQSQVSTTVGSYISSQNSNNINNNGGSSGAGAGIVSGKNLFGNNKVSSSSVQSDELAQCWELLQKLKKQKSAEPFLRPVDVSIITDYLQYVKEPIDLGTMEAKLGSGQYSSLKDFAADINKIWSNSYLYNRQDTDIYAKTVEMQQTYEALIKQIEISPLENNLNKLQKKVDKLTRDLKEYSSRDGRFYHKENKKSRLGNDKNMTFEERFHLAELMRSLPLKYQRGIYEIVAEVPLESQRCTEQLTFSLELLSHRKCREIEKYVKQKTTYIEQSKRKRKKKMENPSKQKQNNPESTANPDKELQGQQDGEAAIEVHANDENGKQKPQKNQGDEEKKINNKLDKPLKEGEDQAEGQPASPEITKEINQSTTKEKPWQDFTTDSSFITESDASLNDAY